MAITLDCSCGKSLEVDDIHRGKKAKCPACGNVLLVPETAVQAEPPKPRPVAAPARTKAAPAAKRSMMPWLVGGGCTLLLLLTCVITGGGVGIWYFVFRSDNPDLAFVHADVAGFISIRLGDALKNQAIKDQVARLPAGHRKDFETKTTEMKDKFGLTLEDIERLTIVFRSLQDRRRPGEPELAIVIRAARPFDKKKIFAFLDVDPAGKKHEGAVYHLIEENREQSTAFCFVTDRVLLVTPSESLLKDFLKASSRPATNPSIANGVKLAAAGKHPIVAAFKWDRDAMEQMIGHAQEELASLRDMNAVTITGSIDKQLKLEATGTFASAADAERVKRDLEKFRNQALGFMRGNPLIAQEKIALDMLEATTFEQRGANLLVKSKVEPDLRPLADEFLHTLDFRSPKQLQSVNNLKQIGMAMHSVHDMHKALPSHAIRDPKTGQPILSWRVTLLPYIEQEALYKAIRLDEPWDSAHNRQFWKAMPKIYQIPGKPNDGNTYYQVFHGDESAFPKWMGAPGGHPLISSVRMQHITDGTSNTIFVVEAAQPVNWMKPDDIPFQQKQPGLIDRVGNHWGNGAFHVLMGDGTVRTLRRTIRAETLDALITRAGTEPIDDRDWMP